MASETIAAMNNSGAINLQNGAIGNNLTIDGDYTGVGVINVMLISQLMLLIC